VANNLIIDEPNISPYAEDDPTSTSHHCNNSNNNKDKKNHLRLSNLITSFNENIHRSRSYGSSIYRSDSGGGGDDRSFSSSAISETTTEIVTVQYDEMLSMSPRKISFVIPTNNNSDSNEMTDVATNGVAALTVSSAVKRSNSDDSEELVDATEQSPDDNGTSSPTSVTYEPESLKEEDVKSETLGSLPGLSERIGSLLGLILVKHPKTKQFKIAEHVLSSKGATRQPLLPLQLLILLQPGDILESVNGVLCRRFQSVEQLYQRIIQLLEKEFTLTLTFACVPSDQEQVQQLTATSPFIHQTIFITNNHFVVNKQHHETEDDGEEESPTGDHKDEPALSVLPPTPSELSAQDLLLLLQLNTVQKEDVTTNTPILHLASIPSHSWLYHSPAKVGDVVLS
jgi:hypothetical protein